MVPGWYAEVSGDAFDLEGIQWMLEHGPHTLIKEDGSWLIGSAEFSDIEDQSEVSDRARRLVDSISGAYLLIDNRAKSLTFNGISKHPRDPAEPKLVTGTGTTTLPFFRARGRATVTTIDGQSQPHPPSPALKWIALSAKNRYAEELLWLLAQPAAWVNLRKIHELTKESGSHSWFTGCNPGEQVLLNAFARTVNNFAGSGRDSAHAYNERSSDPNPMFLGDAEQLLRKVARDWLEKTAHEAGL